MTDVLQSKIKFTFPKGVKGFLEDTTKVYELIIEYNNKMSKKKLKSKSKKNKDNLPLWKMIGTAQDDLFHDEYIYSSSFVVHDDKSGISELEIESRAKKLEKTV